jgi:hypothetical protein
MEKRNAAALIKNTPRCTTCERHKKAQFFANPIRSLTLDEITKRKIDESNGVSGSTGGSPSVAATGTGSSVPSAVTTGISAAGGTAGGAALMGSAGTAGTSAAGAAAGTAGTSAAGAAAGTATGLGSRLMSGLGAAGRFGLGAAAVAGPAAGTYFGAKWIEEAISSALSASTEIRPAVRYNSIRMTTSKINLDTAQMIISRMTNLSSHVDNFATKLGTVMGATASKLDSAQMALSKKRIRNKSK